MFYFVNQQSTILFSDLRTTINGHYSRPIMLCLENKICTREVMQSKHRRPECTKTISPIKVIKSTYIRSKRKKEASEYRMSVRRLLSARRSSIIGVNRLGWATSADVLYRRIHHYVRVRR